MTPVEAPPQTQTGETTGRPILAWPRRRIWRLALAAIAIVVAIAGVFLVPRLRASESAVLAPRIISVAPADGANEVALVGELRITFAAIPQNTPALTFAPPFDGQEAVHWEGKTLVVTYAGLRAQTLYLVSLSDEYRSVFGEVGHFGMEWSFITELGPPPTGIPLIWYSPSAFATPGAQLATQIALDWTGAEAGILHLPGNNFQQSPDGSRLWAPGLGTIDESGQLVGPMQLTKAGPVWADDSRHVCAMGAANGPNAGFVEGAPSWIYAGPVDAELRRVAQAGRVAGQSGPQIVACSSLNDRVVVVEDVVAWTSDVWVYRLSTGTLLYHRAYVAGQVASSAVASHDGQFLAEQLLSNDSQGHQVAGDTLIRRTSDGKVVGRMAGRTVVAFSWDGSQVITATAYGSTNANELRLVDWQRGLTLWRSNAPVGTAPGSGYVYAMAQPGGSAFVVATGGANQEPAASQLWLVHADGASSVIARGTIYPSF